VRRQIAAARMGEEDRGKPLAVTPIAPTDHGEVDQACPAIPESVPRMRQAVVALAEEAGAADAALDAIRLATSEALTNVVVHAYDGDPGPIRLHAAVQSGDLAVSIADDGHGLRPTVNRRGMGLGLAIIAEAAKELSICRRPAGGTELRMRFSLAG
jgi:anti-sigma regulatory factor (Ser/Thr protein kinase)